MPLGKAWITLFHLCFSFFFIKSFSPFHLFYSYPFEFISSKVSPALLSKMRKNWNCFFHCFNFCKHFPYLSGFSRVSAKYFEAFIYIFFFLEQIRIMYIPLGLKEFFYTICTFETLNMAMKTWKLLTNLRRYVSFLKFLYALLPVKNW